MPGQAGRRRAGLPAGPRAAGIGDFAGVRDSDSAGRARATQVSLRAAEWPEFDKLTAINPTAVTETK